MKENLAVIAELKRIYDEEGAVALVSSLLFCAFTPEQKRWFHERDNHQCQFPVDYDDTKYTPCGRPGQEVHHIEPQRWCKNNGVPEEEIDSATNGILLCRDHHQNVIHGPDMPLAKANYRADKNSYKKAFKKREQLVEAGLKYWNDTWDHVLKKIANVRTERFDREFPAKKWRERQSKKTG